MIDLLAQIQATLKGAGYSTWLTEFETLPVICFEDEVIFGFVSIFSKPNDLITRWRPTETSILRRFASNIRGAGEKAWNVYSVFLCSEAASDTEAREIRWIEENLERTRKLTANGVVNREDVAIALLPLLPLQHQPLLLTDDFKERLKRRIQAIAPKAAEVALDDEIPAIEVARLLGVQQ
jgi:hypothetical protein